MTTVITGLKHLTRAQPSGLAEKRLGLLCNPASVDERFRHARHVISRLFPGRLKALFSPQHGFFAEKQDNMVESANFFDKELQIPVFSLYGATRIPTPEMMDGIDVLIVDLQDAGTRVYTFFTTLSYCMEEAARQQKAVMILDRPNPVGGLQVEGNCLEPGYASFVGRYPIPMRHGLTIGEYARLINAEFHIGCDLSVISMKGWNRHMYYPDTGLAWIPPSPNLPTPASAMVYPGQVLWEGTNVSEGRGTTQPFELFGAPWMDTHALENALGEAPFSGAVLRPAVFEPTSGKWVGRSCHGFQIHVTDREKYLPYQTSLALVGAVRKLFGNEFAWKMPPYEYEWEKLPFDLITGDTKIRSQLEAGVDAAEMARNWQAQTEAYQQQIRPYLLYE
ncbi:MAG: DUF1343 domain-containing protein [Desulfobacterales bacterium]|nr:DUF1343 domain-containing protein [Desulfobacterales bacterium]